VIAAAALVVGIVLGLILRPTVPTWLEPYLPIAVVAALDAVFGGIRARLDGIFDAKVFVVSFISNVLVAALIVFLGDNRGDPPAPVQRMSRQEPQQRSPRRRQASAAVIGVLTLLLGFAIAVQVHANSTGDALAGLQDSDLIGILDTENARADRLRAQITQLQDNLQQLRTSGDRSLAARRQEQQEARALAVLLGTVPAHGPGIVATITDPAGKLTGEDLLDVVEELRGAGAEAIQFGPVRVSTNTAFTGGDGSVDVDGTTVAQPYVVLAIGGPTTLDTALNIPGGVAATVRTAGGRVTVREMHDVVIRATTALPTFHYAVPVK
jgi:uncharacterized protein YlxW (UPF0749 family)/small basic protein